MTVYLAIEDRADKVEQDVDVFKTFKKARDYIDKRIQTITCNSKRLRIGCDLGDYIDVAWIDDEYGCDDDIYTRFWISEKTVK